MPSLPPTVSTSHLSHPIVELSLEDLVRECTLNQQQQVDLESTTSLNAAKSLVHVGLLSSNLVHAQNSLRQACNILQDLSSLSKCCSSSPVLLLLVRARHRLAQIAAVQGNFRQALYYLNLILNDNNNVNNNSYNSNGQQMTATLMLSLAWYDKALILSSQEYQSISQALDALGTASSLLLAKQKNQDEEQLDPNEEIALFYIEQAEARLLHYYHHHHHHHHHDHQQQHVNTTTTTSTTPRSVPQQKLQQKSGLPWSLEFMVLSPDRQIQKMLKLLRSEQSQSIRAAGVA